MASQAPEQPREGEIEVVLNGAATRVPAGETVADLLRRRDLPHRGVAVEVSGEIVPRGNWPRRELRAGDHIEIVHMVGGG